jgi:hypothetical protein
VRRLFNHARPGKHALRPLRRPQGGLARHQASNLLILVAPPHLAPSTIFVQRQCRQTILDRLAARPVDGPATENLKQRGPRKQGA